MLSGVIGGDGAVELIYTRQESRLLLPRLSTTLTDGKNVPNWLKEEVMNGSRVVRSKSPLPVRSHS